MLVSRSIFSIGALAAASLAYGGTCSPAFQWGTDTTVSICDSREDWSSEAKAVHPGLGIVTNTFSNRIETPGMNIVETRGFNPVYGGVYNGGLGADVFNFPKGAYGASFDLSFAVTTGLEAFSDTFDLSVPAAGDLLRSQTGYVIDETVSVVSPVPFYRLEFGQGNLPVGPMSGQCFTLDNLSFATTVTPEPSTWTLMAGAGLFLFVIYQKRKLVPVRVRGR